MNVFFIELCRYTSVICSFIIMLFLAFHDWIDLYPLNDLKTFNKYCSLRNKIIMTAINTPFFILYTTLLLYYWTTPFPLWTKIYMVICNILFFTGIIFSWWLPYFFGWPTSQVKELQESHGTTHIFLPAIDDHPIPNTLHVIFHLIFVINMVTSLIIIFS